MKLNLPPKLPEKTWEETLATDYGRIDKEREEEIVLAAAKLSHAHIDPSLRNCAVEGDHVVLRNDAEIVTVCVIDLVGELRVLPREVWPEKYQDGTVARLSRGGAGGALILSVGGVHQE